jgi:molybdopterin-containing oxidoreductase family iron-sulfur binding subunit
MSKKNFWISLDEYYEDPDALKQRNNEFQEDPFDEVFNGEGMQSNRRDFLKVLGFGLTAATLAACQKTPVRYAVPYVNKPVDTTPGVANYYASTFYDGQEYASVLVKAREGRPIKIHGNKLSSITQGGSSVRAESYLLGLYDNNRLKTAVQVGKDGTYKQLKWGTVDAQVRGTLSKEHKIRILTPTVISPSTQALIADFKRKYPNTQHVQYDPVSYQGITEANRKAFGKGVFPRYHFDQADMIVGFNCDFLGTWGSHMEYNRQFAERRRVRKDWIDSDDPQKKLNRFVQFEANMSLTGSNADFRQPIKPSEEGALIVRLYNLIVKGQNSGGADVKGEHIKRVAEELKQHKGRALVVSGANDPNIQLLVNAINAELQSYGSTIDLDTPTNLHQGSDTDFDNLLREMQGGQVDTLMVWASNPVYDHPRGEAFAQAMKNVGMKLGFANTVDETNQHCDFILGTHHQLESWGDAEPYKGHFSLQQPTIQPLFSTRQFQDSLLAFLGDERDYYKYVKDHWKKNIAPGSEDFSTFWNKRLHDGIHEEEKPSPKSYSVQADVAKAAAAVEQTYKQQGDGIELQLYQKVGIGAGQNAHIPWQQEFPDPVTRATWDNYLLVSPRMCQEQGWSTGDVVKVSVGDRRMELPVLKQPGLHPEVVAAAVGYGRSVAGPAAKDRGVNVFPAVQEQNGFRQMAAAATLKQQEGKTYEIARTQIQGTAMTEHRKESIIKERQYEEYAQNPDEITNDRKAMADELVNLYPDRRPQQGEYHRWAMVVDLNACTGCGACVVSCQVENNIPVVGKEEVDRGREMHWIRIDRYYSVPEQAQDDHFAAENPEEFPEVTFQPMMCQHCDNAPCENVCPVLATVHSHEGLNQQIYNRCFGTRYCANNCPYKVRRFNWFDYTAATVREVKSEEQMEDYGNNVLNPYQPMDDLGRMVLNPDVTVRARGVMEKCSFCVQRLQAGKLEAKREGRKLEEEDVQTACAQACPTNAIKFGDLNDPTHEVHDLINKEGHTYYVIQEVKTQPSVGYMAKIRNQKKGDAVKI